MYVVTSKRFHMIYCAKEAEQNLSPDPESAFKYNQFHAIMFKTFNRHTFRETLYRSESSTFSK